MEMVLEEQSCTTTLSIGQTQADGTIYLGHLPDPEDGQLKECFTTAGDAKNAKGCRLRLNFNDAATYAKNLDAHGHNDWQVPADYVLNEQYQAKNTGDFNGTYKDKFKSGEHETHYTSGTSHPRCANYGTVQYFDKGDQTLDSKSKVGYVRPVRFEYRR